jgi:hypothetical protein
MQGIGVAIYVQSTNLVYQRGTVTRFKNPARHMYQRYAQAPRTRRILRRQSKIHPAPLLIGFAAFQIGSALRGDGDAVDNFFTAPRFTAPGQGRRRTRHVGRFFGP